MQWQMFISSWTPHSRKQIGPHVPKDKDDFHGKTGTRDGAEQLVTQLAMHLF